MTPIYDKLVDRRPALLGGKHWFGNLRWVAEEMERPGVFAFRTCPLDATENEQPWKDSDQPAARRTLFGLQLILPDKVEGCEYRADELALRAGNASFSILLPLENYGALVEIDTAPGGTAGLEILMALDVGRRPVVEKAFASEVVGKDRVVWRDGAYTLVYRFSGQLTASPSGGFRVQADLNGKLRLAVGFHIDPNRAAEEAEALFDNGEKARAASREAWEAYLASCPVIPFEKDYTWHGSNGSVTHTSEEILQRQYWHWHCVLANVYQLSFNRLTAFMAPDKANWFGSWSNDGPECLRALARTNRRDLARECLVEYVRTAINAEGDHSWYLHGTGEGCLGNPGDNGRLSHGLPAIVTAVWEYIKVTGDATLLAEPAGEGGTVWEKLRRFMQVVYARRDRDGDGLVEWANLWEGGPDDKVGPFFSRATLGEWIEAVLKLPEHELNEFYDRNLRPVTNIYEQAFFLHGLESLEQLSLLRGDEETARYSRCRFDQTCRVLEDRHWDDADGFYYDWDVYGLCLNHSKNQDAFYLPRFLRNGERSARLFAHLDDPQEFGLLHTPTLAANEQGFRPDGYWCGGYWPRESAYIAMALQASGRSEKAIELLIKALCISQGKIIPENLSPLTGHENTGITGMAYNIMVVLALCEIAGESAH